MKAPRSFDELRQALGPTEKLFVIGADNPQPTMRNCGDGTTIVGQEPLPISDPRHEWWVGISEHGGASYPGVATFRSEHEACFFAYCLVLELPWSPSFTDLARQAGH